MDRDPSYPLVPYGDKTTPPWPGSQRSTKRTGPKRWEREQVLRLMTYVVDVMDQERAAREELKELGATVRQLNAMLIAMAPWVEQLIPKRSFPLKTQGLDAVSLSAVPFVDPRRRESRERAFGYSE